MARAIRLVCTCDVCGVEVDEKDPIGRFSYQGKTYIRDMCATHCIEFTQLMDMLVGSSTVDTEVPKVPKSRSGQPTSVNGRPLGRPRGKMPTSTCRYCDKTLSAITLVRHTQRFHPDLSADSVREVAEQAEKDNKRGVAA